MNGGDRRGTPPREAQRTAWQRAYYARMNDRTCPPRRRSKQDCPTCQQMRAADPHGRWPVGLCGPDCVGWLYEIVS